MWVFLAGVLGMAGFLAAIGITRNRWLGVRRWTAVWTGASLAFAGVLVVAFLDGGPLAMEAVHGAAVGYVASVGVHTLHHFVSETREADTPA